MSLRPRPSGSATPRWALGLPAPAGSCQSTIDVGSLAKPWLVGVPPGVLPALLPSHSPSSGALSLPAPTLASGLALTELPPPGVTVSDRGDSASSSASSGSWCRSTSRRCVGLSRPCIATRRWPCRRGEPPADLTPSDCGSSAPGRQPAPRGVPPADLDTGTRNSLSGDSRRRGSWRSWLAGTRARAPAARGDPSAAGGGAAAIPAARGEPSLEGLLAGRAM
jgi:hypothetical protein